jgi:hypothetical protein
LNTTTKVRRPQSNDFVERLHRMLLDKHFRIKGRDTWYESVDAMQTDLDAYFLLYGAAHQGRGMQGRTPNQAFLEGIVQGKETETEEAG